MKLILVIELKTGLQRPVKLHQASVLAPVAVVARSLIQQSTRVALVAFESVDKLSHYLVDATLMVKTVSAFEVVQDRRLLLL